MQNELEEEFYRVEGRPASPAAYEYVQALQRTPDGDRISATARATLWYLAYWTRDGVARISVANLAAHLDCSVWETRGTLQHLVMHCVVELLPETRSLEDSDVHAYKFVELGG
jgi:hypothetical protein